MPRKTGLDAIDRRILAELMEDGRRPNKLIARDVGLSESSVRQRVARMRRDGVMRIAAMTDVQRLGMWTAVVGLRVTGGDIRAAADDIARVPEVNFVSLCIGTCDISIGVVCRSRDELYQVLADKVRAVEGVEQVAMHMHVEVVKDTLAW